MVMLLLEKLLKPMAIALCLSCYRFPTQRHRETIWRSLYPPMHASATAAPFSKALFDAPSTAMLGTDRSGCAPIGGGHRFLSFQSTQPLRCSSIIMQRRNREADSRLPRPRGVMPERPFSCDRAGIGELTVTTWLRER
jgi:hypothetical protein